MSFPDFNSDLSGVSLSPPVNSVAGPVGDSAPSVAPAASNPTLESFTQRMAELEARLNKHRANISKYNHAMELVDGEKDELLKETQRKLAALDEEKYAIHKEKRVVETELAQLDWEMRELRAEHAAALEEMQASQALNNLYASLKEAWENLPWAGALFDFQKEDILFTLQCYEAGKTGVLNANDRGMGKTFESGATIDLITHVFNKKHGRAPRILWLTKKGIVGQTYRELRKWNPDRKVMVVGMRSIVQGALYDSIKMGAPRETREMQVAMSVQANAIVLANYDILNTTQAVLDVHWDVVIIDEVHKLKGGANCTISGCKHGGENCRATGLWKKTKQIVNRYNPDTDSMPFFLPLSGTPIQNHPKDAWAYLHLFDPIKFPSSKRFEREYAYGYGIEGFKVDWERLIGVLKGQVIRRRKDEVDINLPDKIVEYITDELSGEQAEVYKQMAERMIVKLEGMGDKQLSTSWLLPQWNYLSQILQDPGSVTWREKDPETGSVEEYTLPETNSMKLEVAMELITELVSEGEQVVLFSTFNRPLYKLADLINNAGLEFNGTGEKVTAEVFTGKENSNGRGDDIQQRFQAGTTKVILCNLEAGGEGLNLQKNPSQWDGGAAHAIFLNLWWNPAKNVQGEDRIHRTGQTDQAIIHIIQAENSIDEYIAEVNAKKQAMQDGIMESEEIRPAVEWAQIMKGWL